MTSPSAAALAVVAACGTDVVALVATFVTAAGAASSVGAARVPSRPPTRALDKRNKDKALSRNDNAGNAGVGGAQANGEPRRLHLLPYAGANRIRFNGFADERLAQRSASQAHSGHPKVLGSIAV